MSSTDKRNAVAITLDNELKQPDWEAAEKHLRETTTTRAVFRHLEVIKQLWEDPSEDHTSIVEVRGGRTLVVGDDDTGLADAHRLMVTELKANGALEAARFDSSMALGTRDRSFALWFTPREIVAEIEDNEDLDLADFEPEAIEAAILDVLNWDSSYGHFDSIRYDIVHHAESLTVKLRKNRSEVAS